MHRTLLSATAALFLALAATQPAVALGPPIACHPITIGTSAVLPWDIDGKPAKKGVTLKTVVDDYTDAVKGSTSVLVRMEALRRAARFIASQAKESERCEVGSRLYAALADRVLNAEAAERPDARAWFEIGFLAQCYEQSGIPTEARIGIADKITGYAFIRRAIALARDAKDQNIAELEYAAALMTHPAMRHVNRSNQDPGLGNDIYDAHIRAAAVGAAPGSLLETNLAAHLANWGGSLEQVRARAKAQALADGTADGDKRK